MKNTAFEIENVSTGLDSVLFCRFRLAIAAERQGFVTIFYTCL
jgi:hypothetical protein